MFLAMFVYVAAIIYLPLYFEACLRLDPTLSGVSLIGVLGASVVSSNFTGLSIPKMWRYKALGYYGMPYDRDELRIDANMDPIGPDYSVGLMSEHLLRRAATIYGGTNEVQRNIIAKRVLGLPS